MNWRNPKKELPENNQIVWVMVEPHKDRGSLKESLMSVEIVCGKVLRTPDFCRVENFDELGYGNTGWNLWSRDDDYEARAIAWLPVDEMPLPPWVK